MSLRAKSGPKTKGARLPRRSARELLGIVNELVTIVTNAPDGIGAERLRLALQVDGKELRKPIALALASQRIRKTGEKRSTLYFTTSTESA